MTVCSTPETNTAVSWRPNRIIAPPMKKSTMSTIKMPRRTPTLMRSTRPAPRFCPTYVPRDNPMMLHGCSARPKIFEPVVYAATIVEPKPFTTPCKIIPPIAVMEFIIPTGKPSFNKPKIIDLSMRFSPALKRKTGIRRNTKRHIRPESSCAKTVAHAAPATPHLKAMTNRMSSPMFTAELMRMIMSGDMLSPSARRILESVL